MSQTGISTTLLGSLCDKLVRLIWARGLGTCSSRLRASTLQPGSSPVSLAARSRLLLVLCLTKRIPVDVDHVCCHWCSTVTSNIGSMKVIVSLVAKVSRHQRSCGCLLLLRLFVVVAMVCCNSCFLVVKSFGQSKLKLVWFARKFELWASASVYRFKDFLLRV
jgi:hypothetical protein